jgi:hypothetical protein
LQNSAVTERRYSFMFCLLCFPELVLLRNRTPDGDLQLTIRHERLLGFELRVA